MRRPDRRLLRAIVLASSLCAPLVAQNQPGPHPLRVLFLGNSYTFFNNLPDMFARLAEAGGQQVQAAVIAPGGWRLQDHWNNQQVRAIVRDGRWDYVVLQEQSRLGVDSPVDEQPVPMSDSAFRPYADKWAAEIRNAGARVAFYLTWAREEAPEDQSQLNDAYERAARANQALLVPVGMAWAQVRRQHRSIRLYYADGSHPSPAGTYLAACTFYAALFDKNPEGLPARIVGNPVNIATGQADRKRTAVLVDLAPATAQVLQSAAWSAWTGIR